MKRAIAMAIVSAIAFAGGALWAQDDPPPPGRGGGGRAGGGRGAAGAQNAGRRGPNFPQQTRPLASAEVLARGKAVYGVNCAACHGADLRGGDQGGPSLLRSLPALSDQHGEEIGPIIHGSRQDKGMPAFNLTEADTVATAEYIHSVLAKVGTQARPPGAIDPSSLNVLVGNAAAGESYFKSKCAGCHSTTGDLKGIAAKYDDPRTLQNTWVSGGGGGGRRGGGENTKPSMVTVTLAGGQKVEGTLVRKDDFLVTLMTADGTRKTVSLEDGTAKAEVHDPNAAHKKLVPTLTDKDMHDVTAFLATVK